MGNSANVVFVARFSNINQTVCFSTKSLDRKRFNSFLGGVNGQPLSRMAVDVHVAYLLTIN